MRMHALYKALAAGAFALLAASPCASASDAAVSRASFNEVIFEAGGGKINAPRATRSDPGAPLPPDFTGDGWRAGEDGGHISFNADEVLPKDEGTLEIKLTVLDAARLTALGNDLEALVTVYDGSGVAFFTVGMNDHDLTVGSFPLHPMIMEDVFGAVGFPYLAKLDGPLKDGTDMTVRVTWGRVPSDNRVYLNGKRIGPEEARGPKTSGKGPGYEPVKTLGPFFAGFEGNFNGRETRRITPPRSFVIGMKGKKDPSDRLSMHPPNSVAIRSVRLSSLPEKF